MINFASSLLDTDRHRVAGSSCNRSLETNSQKVANPSPTAFAATLAAATADPNSSQVLPVNSGSQGNGTGRNPVTIPSGLSVLVPPTETAPASATTQPASASASTWYSSSAADNAYWAQQPAAVQQLRNMPDEAQREQVGMQLAQQGYAIDVPVMVWGWDPGITTQLRETAGYTWVPSALQQPVSEAPGLNVPGLTPYDPSNPPPGSILVG